MDSMDKLWGEVDSLKETRIRHDERMKRLEMDNKQLFQHVANVESSVSEMRDEMREGFRQMNERIGEMNNQKVKQSGYALGAAEERKKLMKQFALWVSIAAIAVSFVTWWFTK